MVGQASRIKDIREVEEDLAEFDYLRLRDLQMELLELTFEDQWGQHLSQVREELKHEALQFVKEQRVRCLLSGSWFPRLVHKSDSDNPNQSRHLTWRYAKLSHNRRYLHYSDYVTQTSYEPMLDQLHDKIDLSTISSVVSNVSATTDDTSSISSTSTLKDLSHAPSKAISNTKITINSYNSHGGNNVETSERAILTLHPQTHTLASEWLDGLLMLLNQTPITAETNKLIGLVTDYGLKIRLLNVRAEDRFEGPADGAGLVPSREGVDEDYFFEV